MNVTAQFTTYLPDTSVEKCSLTVVSCAFSPSYQTNQWQSEQLQLVVAMEKGDA